MKNSNDLGKQLEDLILLTSTQFCYKVDRFSFILGYYSAQGNYELLVNILKVHSYTCNDLKPTAKIQEESLRTTLYNLRRIIYNYCKDNGLNIPYWLSRAIENEKG